MNITSIVVTIVTALFLSIGIVLFNNNTNDPTVPPEDMVACTMDALECPDGSYVGRTGPNCEFAACPSTDIPTPPSTSPGDEPVSSDDVMCTMDVRECRDGSFVGRVAPSCAFEACPDGNQPLNPVVIGGSETMCSPESKTADACIEIYAPVCASVQVECVTAPCEPVKQTFSNSCFACIEDRVLSYTEGACFGDEVSY